MHHLRHMGVLTASAKNRRRWPNRSERFAVRVCRKSVVLKPFRAKDTPQSDIHFASQRIPRKRRFLLKNAKTIKDLRNVQK